MELTKEQALADAKKKIIASLTDINETKEAAHEALLDDKDKKQADLIASYAQKMDAIKAKIKDLASAPEDMKKEYFEILEKEILAVKAIFDEKLKKEKSESDAAYKLWQAKLKEVADMEKEITVANNVSKQIVKQKEICKKEVIGYSRTIA